MIQNALGPVFFSFVSIAAAVAPDPALAQQRPSIVQTAVPSLAPMLERVTPAVVNIAVVSRARVSSNPLLNDPYFRRFFDIPGDQQSRPQLSAGSGVIVDAGRGYILTNHHVVENATEVLVTLKDGRRLPARFVGSDRATDIALIQVEARGLQAAEFANSDELRVGDFVVAIGNPFGLGQTVTSGIVSALGRTGLSNDAIEDFIQTDASINPGNSGGALMTLDGRLVGINSAILSPAGGNIGIGFAIPINMARSVMEQLALHGEVRRGRLGISVQDLTPDLASALRTTETRGAVVAEVEQNSPAGRAGLRPSDLILSVDGRPVQGAADLRARIAVAPRGRALQLRIFREGQIRDFSVIAVPQRN